MGITGNLAQRVKASLRLTALTAHQFAYEVFGERVLRGDKSQKVRKHSLSGRRVALRLSRLTDKLPGGSLG